MSNERAKILIVDDLAEKLVVYETILEELGEELVMVRSGAAALKQILQHEFAVILLDVNMPDMDGFETAALIRARKRSAHTPIIFITAYADDFHAVKGYLHGAVDYILAPVVPDVLRTKVRVFVDLFHKTREIHRQAESLRELERREHERLLSHATERLNLALEAGRMGAWEWDLSSQLLTWSPTLEEIFGMTPGKFSGTAEELSRRLHAEDREHVLMVLQQAAIDGSEFNLEHRVVRDNGDIVWVEVRGRVFEDALGEAAEEAAQANARVGVQTGPAATRPARARRRIIGVCMDITQRKTAEAELQRHRDNLERLVLERTAELKTSHDRLRLADRLASIGTLAAGLGHDMGNLLLPIRMRLEALEKTLESCAVASTKSIENAAPASDMKTQILDDIKSIKTASEYLKRLSQGLRLFALDPDEAGANELTELSTWWSDVEPFLRNTLPKGVLLQSRLPAEMPAACIPPHTLTQVVYNLVQNAGDALRDRNSGTVVVCADIRSGKPISRGPASARSADGSALAVVPPMLADCCIALEVRDDGPGMSDEVRARCMEPFFTTKTRGISTGFGLALVHGAVYKCGGTVEVESRLGAGTVFRLLLPAHSRPGLRTPSAEAPPAKSLACIRLGDARMRAYVASVLRNLDVDLCDNFETHPLQSAPTVEPMPNGRETLNEHLEILIIEAAESAKGVIQNFLASRRPGVQGRVVIFGECADLRPDALLNGHAKPNGTETSTAVSVHSNNFIWLNRRPAPSQIREALLAVLRAEPSHTTEAPHSAQPGAPLAPSALATMHA